MATKKPASAADKAKAMEIAKKRVSSPDPMLTKKPKPSPSPTLPTLAEFKQSAAYKTGAMTYKQYIDYFKSQGATR